VRRVFLFLAFLPLAACWRAPSPPPGESQEPLVVIRAVFHAGETTMNLPKAVGPWTRPDAPTVVTAETIFDYMDGAGELYVGYRFHHLDVFEYKAADASLGTILVELYWMKQSDDSFGLLSTDWGGEVPDFDNGVRPHHPQEVPPHGALYGAGLLRMCSGRLYVRVLAARETPRSRDAVLAIGREMAADAVFRSPEPRRPDLPPVPLDALKIVPPAMPPPPPPVLLLALRGSPGDGSTIRPDRTCFFRSHLVLNSAYYLASEDILGLGLDVEAVTTEYRAPTPGARPTRLIVVRYPSSDRARAALGSFTQAYLPESAQRGRVGDAGTTRLEQGWAGWMLKGQDLAIALDGSSEAAARQLAASAIAGAPPPARAGGHRLPLAP